MATLQDRTHAADIASVSQHNFTLRASDGFPLAVRLWTGNRSGPVGHAAIVNAGAGIVHSYYDRFAAFLAGNGIPTILYDYRGIGGSRPRTLIGFQASVEEWGSKDCAAVLEWVSSRFFGAKMLVVGHSVGGFVTGFAPNGGKIDRMLLVSAHTGYWRDYASGTRLSMFVLWHALMPVITHVCGYFPGRRLHLLEDLPKGVALDWARRRKPDFWWYLKRPDGSLDLTLIASLLARFRAITGQTLALRFDDDPFATQAATDRILGLYANAPAVQVAIGPVDVGGQKVGHFGFFRTRFRETLWPRVMSWLNASE